jgi:hypothetical protein
MRTMLQSKILLGGLLGFGRKGGTEFQLKADAVNDLMVHLSKHKDDDIKKLAKSAIDKRINTCITEAKKRVLDKNREQVAKILHNGNISSQNLPEYEKCILEIANFFDKCKNARLF